ncbi:MAB_1171c family putative transporter [Nocardia sp. NPDC050175]|uniref:MAB_1171c family putative transporter n=1 Tax=Nocardia sp. NPDC050175 TaxID=3364317 RepID=UPI0037884B1D
MSDLKGVVFPLGAALCALALVYKSFDLRLGRHDPSLLALLVAFLCKGVSFTLSTPAVSAWVDEQLGVPDIGALGIHLSGGVASSAAFLVAIVFWVYPPDRARLQAVVRVALAGAIGVAMTILWAVAATDNREHAKHYLIQNAHRPVVTAYLLLYVTAFGVELIEIIRLSRRYTKFCELPWLRRGLHTTMVGAAVYLVYCLDRGSVAIAVRIGLDPMRWEIVTPISNGLGILLITAGFTMPSWGPRLSAGKHWVRDYITYARLYPLWRAVYQATPAIALDPPASWLADRLTLRSLGYRLYRRVIEIQDGYRALRPYLADDAATSAADTAAHIREAIHAKTRSMPAQHLGHTAVMVHDSGDYRSEITRLLHLARAFDNVPPSARMKRS